MFIVTIILALMSIYYYTYRPNTNDLVILEESDEEEEDDDDFSDSRIPQKGHHLPKITNGSHNLGYTKDPDDSWNSKF